MTSTGLHPILSILGFMLMMPWYFAVLACLYDIFTKRWVARGAFLSYLVAGYYFMFRFILFGLEWIAIKIGLKKRKKLSSPPFIPSKSRAVDEVVLKVQYPPLCPVHKEPMKLRKGPYGSFYGCVMFPSCRLTQKAPTGALNPISPPRKWSYFQGGNV